MHLGGGRAVAGMKPTESHATQTTQAASRCRKNEIVLGQSPTRGRRRSQEVAY